MLSKYFIMNFIGHKQSKIIKVIYFVAMQPTIFSCNFVRPITIKFGENLTGAKIIPEL